MTERLEHANLCVHDIDAVIRFLKTAFPDFKIRQDTTDADGSRWVHVGNNETYIALNQAKAEEAKRGTPYKGRPGLNHLAYEVDDIYAICERLMKLGITINRPPRDGQMAFVRSPDLHSIELLQKGDATPPAEPWASMPNTGHW